MTAEKPQNHAGSAKNRPETDKQKRLSQALRRNLARRKQAVAAAPDKPAGERGGA